MSKNWDKIQSLFNKAINEPREGRRAFLDAACAGDSDLLEEVLALLEHDDDGDKEIESALARGADALLQDPDSTNSFWLGKRLGAWRITEHIASGGMGAVYRAVRADEEYDLTVAIKLLNPAFFNENFKQQFAAERQILARLNHLNIGRLLDGGSTEDGVPWLAMEYIDGERIDRYCKEKSLKEKLNLFIQVCRAVEFAHQNLVVHRDLKPGNILVDKQGQVKLLDFGIAKLLQEDSSEAAPTRMGMLTPGYASPEQINGSSITTSTDVYALGVLLYQLLCGRLPFEREQTQSEMEFIQSILQTPPPLPSDMLTRTGSQHGVLDIDTRSLRGDLDNIVLFALRKEPERRYGSVQALREDIEHFLEDKPVTACPDNFWYLTRKFCKRNRLGLGIAALVFCLFAGMLTIHTVQLKLERDKAQLEAERSAQIYNFLVSVFKDADPTKVLGADIRARELLDTGSARIRFELHNQPEVQSSLLILMGDIYLSLGVLDKSLDFLNTAVSQSARYTDPHIHIQSLITRAEVNFAIGNLSASEADFILALQYLDEHPFPALKIQALSDYANLLDKQGNTTEAEALLEEALLLSASDEALNIRSLHGYAAVQAGKGQLKDAENSLREALQSSQQLYGELHPSNALLYNNLAWVLREQSAFAEAEDAAITASELSLQIYGDEHFVYHDIRLTHAGILEVRGAYLEAEKIYREVLANFVRNYGEDHYASALAMNDLAGVLMKRGAFEEVHTLYHHSLKIHRREFGEDHYEVATNLSNLGVLEKHRGNTRQAIEYVRQALEIRTKELGENHPATIITYRILGSILFDEAQFDEAEKWLNRALVQGKLFWGEVHQQNAFTLVDIAVLKQSQGHIKEAETRFREALDMHASILTPTHPKLAWSRMLLAHNLSEQQRFEEANPLFESAINHYIARFGETHNDVATAKLLYAVSLLKQKNYKDALNTVQDAYEIRVKVFEDNWYVAEAQALFGHILEQFNPEEGYVLKIEGLAYLNKNPGASHFITQRLKGWLEI